MRQKIDIAEVESATKIRAKYLRALENEEFGLLPGTTFVKTFMRTYAEYLGLDAQLLIEEYRVDYEPRGEGEMQPMVSRPSRRQQERRRPRASRGPPGPGTAVVVIVVVVLAIFAILGLTGGNDEGPGSGKSETTAGKKPPQSQRTTAKPAPKRKPTSVRLRIVPTSATYLCVDRGQDTSIVYQGTTVDPQTFRGKHLRVNIGNGSTVRVSANGKRVAIPSTATIVGYEFTPARSRPLPAGQTRPCA
ncbi:MAG: cytoskeleton protein RodZ [Solirubrobacteraceae bacterium]|nr:cytoskeleton protein RodZ [Solirubrobacteraceae bacterium]